MPVETELDFFGAQQSLDLLAIGIAAELINKLFPGSWHGHVRRVLKRVAIVWSLSGAALITKLLLKHVQRRHIFQQILKAGFCQYTLGVEVRIRLDRQEILELQVAQFLNIKIFHAALLSSFGVRSNTSKAS